MRDTLPPTGYLTVEGIQSAVSHVAGTYPELCQQITLPERSHEGRTITGLRIGKGSWSDRPGVLFLGGVHARELINPDLLCSLALRLCQSYRSGTPLTFGSKSFSASAIKRIVDTLDTFVIPLVNPDGRHYVQNPSGDPWWRKNRSPNVGHTCRGVDLNRNFDFLFPSGIGTSTDSCSLVFRGPSAFCEPETRNVRHLLDTRPRIHFMIDVHSYTELILHPWGDDDIQSTDPSMNFKNPAYDGLRGRTGQGYAEYMSSTDRAFFVSAGQEMRDAIAAVRGSMYTVKPGILLYPTSGTAKDYAFSRHFVDTGMQTVYAYTLETGKEFQPVYSEAANVISEASAGLVQFSLSALDKKVAFLGSISPTWARPGDMLTVVIGGRNFVPQRTFVSLGNDLRSEVLEVTPTTIRVGVRIYPATTVGRRSFSVLTPAGRVDSSTAGLHFTISPSYQSGMFATGVGGDQL